VSETVNWSMVLVSSLFAGGVLWSVWRVGQWLLQRERTWSDSLGAVMAATVLRRDRVQTLSVILERSVEALQAACGSLHMVRKDGSGYVLAHTVNVERLDLIVELPASDTFVRQLCGSPVPLQLKAVSAGSPWLALGVPPASVIGLSLGQQALLVLSWPAAGMAENHLSALQSIQRYAEQVLVEFDEVEARAADIQSLSAMLHQQEMLFRTAAHDLANRLAAAHSLLGLATEGSEAPGDRANWVQQAMEQITLSEPLLDEFYDPDRALRCEPLQIEELVRLASAMLARRRRDRAVDFTVEVQPGLPAVRGERLAVLRVLDNLLSNALKHNGQQADLRVWLRVRAGGDGIEIEVEDNGAGIAEDAQANLFEFGFRADSTGRVKGHGLGLWSSRRLVEAMAGWIWYETEPGCGARFGFTLPAVLDGEKIVAPVGEPEPALTREAG
jgi:signal transduction histidine kinase